MYIGRLCLARKGQPEKGRESHECFASLCGVRLSVSPCVFVFSVLHRLRVVSVSRKGGLGWN